MPSRGQAITLSVYAYDTGNSVPKTGDTANISLKLTKDGGTPASPTNALAQVDATNLPGWYQVLLTAAECTANVVVLGGKSSTSGIVISGTQVTFEQLPTAVAAASGGLPTVDASNGVKLSVGTGTGQVSLSSGAVTVGTNSDKTGYSLTQSFPANFGSLVITAGGLVSLNLAQVGLSPRALDSVADSSLTIGDALVAALAAAAGKESVSGTSYVVKTPSTGTVIRTFTLDSGTAPTSRT